MIKKYSFVKFIALFMISTLLCISPLFAKEIPLSSAEESKKEVQTIINTDDPIIVARTRCCPGCPPGPQT